jgi:hypothetical protein
MSIKPGALCAAVGLLALPAALAHAQAAASAADDYRTNPKFIAAR